MRPLSVNTIKQRDLLKAKTNNYTITSEYCAFYGDIYEWDIPESMIGIPPSFIENSLFWTGTIGLAKFRNQYILTPGVPVKWNIYYQPLTWNASPVDGINVPILKTELKDVQYPLLMLDDIPAYIVEGYIQAQGESLVATKQNAKGMQQPFMFSGNGEVKMIAKDISNLKGYMIDALYLDNQNSVKPVEVLDTNVKNFLDPLTTFIDATDGWIASYLGIHAVGTQKASGITTQEAGSMEKRARARREKGLQVRQWWADRVSKATNGEVQLGVKYNVAYRDNNGTDEASVGDTDGSVRDSST